jgi:hypothetical protein
MIRLVPWDGLKLSQAHYAPGFKSWSLRAPPLVVYTSCSVRCVWGFWWFPPFELHVYSSMWSEAEATERVWRSPRIIYLLYSLPQPHLVSMLGAKCTSEPKRYNAFGRTQKSSRTTLMRFKPCYWPRAPEGFSSPKDVMR